MPSKHKRTVQRNSPMCRTARLPAVCVLVIAMTACHVAQAHNLFVLVQPQTEGPDVIDIIFEHGPFPGKGTYNQPLLDRGRNWIQQPGEKDEISLTLKETTNRGKKFLRSDTNIRGPRAILHSVKWGVYNGRLDYFHGKYVEISSAKGARNLARSAKLPLDLVPTADADTLTIQVYFEDKPLANAKVSMWSPGGKESKHMSDASGTIKLQDPRPGLYSFATTRTLKDQTGEFNGEAYKGVMHGTTCSLRWPTK